MKITRNVIMDLIPLYVADEASPDTRALVEEYLECDPELAEAARKSAAGLPGEAPVTLTMEDEMETYKEAKNSMMRRLFILATIISVGVLSLATLAVVLLFFFMR